MPITTISNLKTQLGEGSRPNLFAVEFSFPSAVTEPAAATTSRVNLLCKSAAIPAMTIGQIEVPFRGRSIKLPGDRSFADWTATFISDSDFAVRTRMENWLKFIKDNNYESSRLRDSTGDYHVDLVVRQLNDVGSVLRSYTLKTAFPTDVSTIDVSYDTTDSLQEFTVSFQYSYFTTA